jgi:hypothetical protein
VPLALRTPFYACRDMNEVAFLSVWDKCHKPLPKIRVQSNSF